MDEAEAVIADEPAAATEDGNEQDKVAEDVCSQYWYIHGHHRGCALHAMLVWYNYGGAAVKGRKRPSWLAEMALRVPADIDENVTSRLDVVSNLNGTDIESATWNGKSVMG